jgi:hypothetical protein
MMSKMQVRCEREVQRDLYSEMNDAAIAEAMCEDEEQDSLSGSDGEVQEQIRPTDTHRPDRQTKGAGRNTTTPIYKQVLLVMESDVDQGQWHLRRISPGSNITCSSRGTKKGTNGKRCAKILRAGRVYPCYHGTREFTPRGEVYSKANCVQTEHFFFFCAHGTCLARVAPGYTTQMPVRPGPGSVAGMFWPVASGTMVHEDEVPELLKAGFPLNFDVRVGGRKKGAAGPSTSRSKSFPASDASGPSTSRAGGSTTPKKKAPNPPAAPSNIHERKKSKANGKSASLNQL